MEKKTQEKQWEAFDKEAKQWDLMDGGMPEKDPGRRGETVCISQAR